MRCSLYHILFIVIIFAGCTDSGSEATTINGKEISPELKKKIDEVTISLEEGNYDTTALEELSEMLDDQIVNTGKTITDEYGAFSIKFPCEPKVEHTTQIIENREVEWVQYSVNTDKGGIVDDNYGYSVSYTDDNILSSLSSFNYYIKNQVDYLERTTNCRLETDKVVGKGSGIKCREQIYTMKGKGIQVKYQIICRKGRLYLLSVITDTGNLFNYSISNFFDSFELLTVPTRKTQPKSI